MPADPKRKRAAGPPPRPRAGAPRPRAQSPKAAAPEVVDPDAGNRARASREAMQSVAPTPGVPKPDPILIVDGVKRHFGGLTAVDVEHLEVQRGLITALIGPNGAGKTTFFNLMTGFDQPNEGTWSYDGHDLGGVSAHNVARLGMVRTFQLTKSLNRMSVIENMQLAGTHQTGEKFLPAVFPSMWRREEVAITRRADELLQRFTLDTKREDLAGTLSGGQRKLLEMARALMVQPNLVCLDEPMAGVNPALVQSLLQHVRSLRDELGVTVVFVEHDMDVVMNISDWVIVMAEGRVIAEGPPKSIRANKTVIHAYLGGGDGAGEVALADIEAEVDNR
ncbi:MAG TPA: ABC transporter ATP-binding protein [Euzebya sp.]|nr:ABC transporter ATP-binding protein [Euzebya sp.]